MRHFPLALLLGAFALGLPALLMAQSTDISRVNGSVLVNAGQNIGEASTVNGSIHITAGASVREASTVNGSIELGDHATADTLGTVNGSLALGANSRVKADVSTVNGRIHLATGADIGGHLHNVNGAITLEQAHVAGGIETVSGDITIGASSRVEGGILVDKPSGWFHWNNTDPVVIIGPHAVVQGTLEFRRAVVLKVSDSAQIGTVKGATPVKFSGAMP